MGNGKISKRQFRSQLGCWRKIGVGHRVLARWNQRAWVFTSLEFHVDMWPFAWTGLSTIAEMEAIERGLVHE